MYIGEKGRNGGMAREPILENAVMLMLWREEGPLTPRQVKARLDETHPVAYTTAMTVLMRLWKKGLLRRYRVGRAYAYAPTVGQAQHAAQRMEGILRGVNERAVALGRFVEQLSASDREELMRILSADE